jgi:hypothetical protein
MNICFVPFILSARESAAAQVLRFVRPFLVNRVALFYGA